MTRAVGVDENGGLWAQPIELDATLTQAGQAADAAKTGEAIGKLKDEISDIMPDDTAVDGKPWTSKHIIDMLCPPIEETGNPVQCYPVEGYPMGIKVRMDPVQAGSGDPSPDNIRPITGRDALSVTLCGKNMTSAKDVTIENINRPFFNVGTDFRCVPGITVTASFDVNTTIQPFDASLGLGDRYGVYRFDLPSYRSKLSNGRIDLSCTVTQDHLDSGYDYLCIRPCRYGLNPEPYTVSISNIQIELGSTATPYEHYTGDTIDIALPETVYGGTLDLSTGLVTVEWETKTLDGTEPWAYTQANNGAKLGTNVLNGKASGEQYVSSHFKKYKTINEAIQNGSGIVIYESGYIDIAYPSVTSSEEWKAYLAAQYTAGTPVKIAYTLENPYTIQLTPQQIAALRGVNTVYTDADGVIVTGRENPQHTITELKNAIISLGGNV